METIEGNKIIAEFMGGKIGNGGTKKYPVYTGVPITHSGQTQKWTTSSKDLNYHKSWDWLMPVVEKIYIQRSVRDFNINPGKCTIILKEGEPIVSPVHPQNPTIIEVWQACVDFIVWHNSTLLKQTT